MTWTGRHRHKVNRRQSATYNSWCAMKARCQNPKNERYDGEGGDSAKLFFQEREGRLLDVAFSVLALGIVYGSAFCDARPLIVNGDVSLAFTGATKLDQFRDWPKSLPPDKQMAHGVTIEHIERETQATVRGLCPPDMAVEIRRTQYMKGLPSNTIVIEMAVGGDPW